MRETVGWSRTRSLYVQMGKRVGDLLVSSIASLVAAPIALLICGAIKMEDGGPVLFVQERIGRNGEKFMLYKFRSMPTDVASVPSSHAGDLKVTKVGRVIRRTNLDEVPQLANVLMGTMTLVGPRPAIPAQRDLLEARKRSGVLELKPGLTGLAQVNSYDGMPEHEKAQWDAKYLSVIGLLSDLRIMLSTVTYVFREPPKY